MVIRNWQINSSDLRVAPGGPVGSSESHPGGPVGCAGDTRGTRNEKVWVTNGHP